MKTTEDDNEFSSLVLTKSEAQALERFLRNRPYQTAGASPDQQHLHAILAKLTAREDDAEW